MALPGHPAPFDTPPSPSSRARSGWGNIVDGIGLSSPSLSSGGRSLAIDRVEGGTAEIRPNAFGGPQAGPDLTTRRPSRSVQGIASPRPWCRCCSSRLSIAICRCPPRRRRLRNRFRALARRGGGANRLNAAPPSCAISPMMRLAALSWRRCSATAPFSRNAASANRQFLMRLLHRGHDATFAELLGGLNHDLADGARARVMAELRIARRRAALLIAIADHRRIVAARAGDARLVRIRRGGARRRGPPSPGRCRRRRRIGAARHCRPRARQRLHRARHGQARRLRAQLFERHRSHPAL